MLSSRVKAQMRAPPFSSASASPLEGVRANEYMVCDPKHLLNDLDGCFCAVADQSDAQLDEGPDHGKEGPLNET